MAAFDGDLPGVFARRWNGRIGVAIWRADGDEIIDAAEMPAAPPRSSFPPIGLSP